MLTEVAELAEAGWDRWPGRRAGRSGGAGGGRRAGRAPRAEPGPRRRARPRPVDKLSWRMPPLSELPAPVIRGARRIGLLGLRGYLAIAMIMVIVKIIETALGH